MIKTSKINLMEVCGTHTMSIAQYGLKKLFPEGVHMLSGPGCPVCVSSMGDIDAAIEIARIHGVIITTFGDMIRVPGSLSSLQKELAVGADIRVLYSPFDSLEIAVKNPGKKVVFIGVGFETTSPTIAATVLEAEKRKIKNFFVLPMFKTLPNALKVLIKGSKCDINGFLLPGHVSAVIGVRPYQFIPKDHKIPCVIGGFEAQDILKSVKMLIDQIDEGKPKVEVQYKRAVKLEGNPNAVSMLYKVFEPCNANWRAIGRIADSGLKFRSKYRAFDAFREFSIKPSEKKEPRNCLCGQILMGVRSPRDCKLFAKACTPQKPVGPCMVSSEGACAAVYKYGE